MNDDKRRTRFDQIVDAYEKALMETPDAELGQPAELLALAADTRLTIHRAVESVLNNPLPGRTKRRRHTRWPVGGAGASPQAISQPREGLRASFSAKSTPVDDGEEGEFD